VPQDIVLYESLNGYDNMKYFAAAEHVKRADRMAAIKKAAEIVAFDNEVLQKKVATYSGGMKRRLNIAVALINNPKLVILDEPTAGVDVISRNQIISALHRLSKAGTAIIYVGHYMSEIEELCDYICLLDNGRVVVNTDMDKALIRDEKKITLEELYNTVKGDADSREQERE
jgi:ABC-2 type transport system ATP-binding protein